MPSLEERMLAALKVYCLWSWLETHPDKGKKDYPLFEELIVSGPDSPLCPWCEAYYLCETCPLSAVGQGCDCGSWFYTWLKTSEGYQTFTSENQRIALLNERSRAAGEIANLARKEYKRCESLSGQAR